MQILYQAYAEQIQVERATERLIEVLNLVFERPFLMARQIEAALSVPFRSAARYVEKFVQLGIWREIAGQARNRIFRAEEIIMTIEGRA